MNAEAVSLDLSHVFHSWSAQAKLAPVPIARAQGMHLWDYEGKRYLDFSSQLVNTNAGHAHPRIVEAMKRQIDELVTLAPASANAVRGAAAERILSHAPDSMHKVFFTNGGADANENAFRMARLFTGRDKIMSTYRSYHGNTGGAIVATGDWRRMPNEFARGHVHFFGPYLYRSEFWAQNEQQEAERALHHLRRMIEAEGASTIAAILLETVPGTAGVLVPPTGYLAGVRALCDEFGILLILDEVMAGFGRCGEWFAFDAFDVRPDIITFAKGVNSGYVPVGGVMMTREIAAIFDERVFPGGLTYSGHPLAMASIIGAMDAFDNEGIIENAKTIGQEHLAPGLQKLAAAHAGIGEVRGLGVFWALELVSDGATRRPVDDATMGKLKGEMLQRGLMPFIANNRIHVVPPCVINPEQVDEGLSIIDEALTAVGL
jgi:taurine--2-oxoglutarate transaminase